MTLHTTALTLFASTISAALGLVVTASTLAGPSNGIALLGGLALLLMGTGFFVGVAARAARAKNSPFKVVFGAFAAGVLCVWFWLVPAQAAVMTTACYAGNLGACSTVMHQGGFGAQVAQGNEAFVTYECEVKRNPKYCRLAAAKRLSHPGRFCPNLAMNQGFEVVEWCTPNRGNSALVARR